MRALAILSPCAMAIVVAACGGANGGAPTPAMTTAATATASASATAPDRGARILTVGAAEPLPEGVSLIIETGCWQCDGPTEALIRMQRGTTAIEAEPVFTGPIGGRFAVSEDGRRIAVAICQPGDCGGLGEPGPDVTTTVSVSQDGGATFTTLAPLRGFFTVAGLLANSVVMAGPYGRDARPGALLLPAGDDIRPPAPGAYTPVVLPPDGVFWLTPDRDRIVSRDGQTLFAPAAGSQITDIRALDAGGKRFAVATFASGRYSLLIVTRGAQGAAIDQAFDMEGAFIRIGGALADGRLIGNAGFTAEQLPAPATGVSAWVGYLPAIIDLESGTVHPVTDPFLRAPYLNGRNHVVAVVPLDQAPE